MDTGRLETFSDGVFAIAITLLILDVHAGSSGTLAHRLSTAWPGYVGYAVSFTTIGIMWANHHTIFRLIDRASHGLVVANLLLLLAVGFLPFPTSIMAQYLRGGAGADQRTAALFYSGTFTLMAVCYNALWRVAATGNRLIVPGRERAAAGVTRRFRYGVPAYLVATAAAVWDLRASLAIDAALALFYLLPQRDPTDVS